MLAIFDWVMMDVNAQINGIVAIEDMTGFNLRHSIQLYNTENSKKCLAIFQVNYDIMSRHTYGPYTSVTDYKNLL